MVFASPRAAWGGGRRPEGSWAGASGLMTPPPLRGTSPTSLARLGSYGARDFVGRQYRKGGPHQRHHRGAVLVVGHDAKAHGIDAEIADRRAQALFEGTVAVG